MLYIEFAAEKSIWSENNSGSRLAAGGAIGTASHAPSSYRGILAMLDETHKNKLDAEDTTDCGFEAVCPQRPDLCFCPARVLL